MIEQKSPCGIVRLTNDRKQWSIWIFDWLHSTHDSDVAAVIMLQKLTLPGAGKAREDYQKRYC